MPQNNGWTIKQITNKNHQVQSIIMTKEEEGSFFKSEKTVTVDFNTQTIQTACATTENSGYKDAYILSEGFNFATKDSKECLEIAQEKVQYISEKKLRY
jgi:hypothetical protein